MTDFEAVLSAGIRHTPLLRAVVHHRGRRVPFGLKVEQYNVTGSVKARTAASLLRSLHERGPLRPGTVVVESTSGNLGLALSALLRQMECRFIAVIDPRTPPQSARALREAATDVVLVDTPDGHGGYLLRRLAYVRQLCADNPHYRWTNQYENPANPAVHAATTGPEVLAQAPEMTAIYVPVSTGGTLAGIARFLRRTRPQVTVVAVDAAGSAAITRTVGVRTISGIGMSRQSSFLRPDSFDHAIHIADPDAIAVCHLITEDLGLRLGGSSGSTVAAMLADMHRGGMAGAAFSVCLCADGGERYAETLYSDDWLSAIDLEVPVKAAIEQLRADGVHFAWQ